MSQKMVISPDRRRFYCWSWDRWKEIWHLRQCFKDGCLFMYEPQLAHLRKGDVGGIRIPAGTG